jgi:hypothetical protein
MPKLSSGNTRSSAGRTLKVTSEAKLSSGSTRSRAWRKPEGRLERWAYNRARQ